MQATTIRTHEQSATTRFLLTCGAVGPLLFILVFLIEGATRPGYSAWRHFVSQLSLSSYGWMQILNFLLCGALTLAFTIGLLQVLRPSKSAFCGTLLLGVFSIGLLVAGLFSTDPALGYPVGVPEGHQTLHGIIHGFSGLIVFTSLTAACFVFTAHFARQSQWKRWALYSFATGVLIITFFIASMVVSTFDARGILPDAPTGLLQRCSIITGWVWIALTAIQLLKKSAPRQ